MYLLILPPEYFSFQSIADINENRVYLQYYQIPKDYAHFPPQKDAFDMLVEELYENSL